MEATPVTIYHQKGSKINLDLKTKQYFFIKEIIISDILFKMNGPNSLFYRNIWHTFFILDD